MLLEKDHAPIINVIERAVAESRIEGRLLLIKQTLSKLVPKHDVNNLGVAFLTNSADLSEKLRESVAMLRRLQSDEDGAFCGPFRSELTDLETTVIVAYEKIDLFVAIEADLTSASETFALYALDVQQGRLRQLLKDLCLSWKEIYTATLAQHQQPPQQEPKAATDGEGSVVGSSCDSLGIVDALSSGSVDQELITMHHAIASVQAELACFLRTRVNVFPRLSLVLQTSSRVSLSRMLSSEKVSKMFPQVKKVVLATNVKGGFVEATGYVHVGGGSEKKFSSPIRMTDIPVDLFLAQMLVKIRELFRAEVLECVTFHRGQMKQQAATTILGSSTNAMVSAAAASPSTGFSMHAMFLARMIVFWNRLTAALSDCTDIREFRRWLLRARDTQAERIAGLQNAYQTLRTGPISDEAVLANRNCLGAELCVLDKVCAFMRTVYGRYGSIADAQFLWNASIKFVLHKETGELNILIKDKVGTKL